MSQADADTARRSLPYARSLAGSVEPIAVEKVPICITLTEARLRGHGHEARALRKATDRRLSHEFWIERLDDHRTTSNRIVIKGMPGFILRC